MLLISLPAVLASYSTSLNWKLDTCGSHSMQASKIGSAAVGPGSRSRPRSGLGLLTSAVFICRQGCTARATVGVTIPLKYTFSISPEMIHYLLNIPSQFGDSVALGFIKGLEQFVC
ncbi:uncharacterized protein LOC135160231 [Diachasmimorpha longicaudata]|uniref:uncharacterized protein LOC135160231 n=1 Tax=Diachasmimorpha longicaudata TaxID=58733 RepID=UPI0030B91432